MSSWFSSVFYSKVDYPTNPNGGKMTDLVPQTPKQLPKFPFQKLLKPGFYIIMAVIIYLAGVIFTPPIVIDEIIAEAVWVGLVTAVEIYNRKKKTP